MKIRRLLATILCTTLIAGMFSYPTIADDENPEHTHLYTYMDKGDGTHDKKCECMDVPAVEEHIYMNDICVCGAKNDETGSAEDDDKVAKEHNIIYVPCGNSMHMVSCDTENCNDHNGVENCNVNEGICIYCGEADSSSKDNVVKSKSENRMGTFSLNYRHYLKQNYYEIDSGDSIEWQLEDYICTDGSYTFQWYKDNEKIEGETERNLVIENIYCKGLYGEYGYYYCEITDSDGEISKTEEAFIHVRHASDERISDGNNHWKVCACGEVLEFEPCSYTNGVCSVCGFEEGVSEHVHKMVAYRSYMSNHKGHTLMCQCGYTEAQNCILDGNTCKVCGVGYREYPAVNNVTSDVELNVGEEKIVFEVEDISEMEKFTTHVNDYTYGNESMLPPCVEVRFDGNKCVIKGKNPGEGYLSLGLKDNNETLLIGDRNSNRKGVYAKYSVTQPGVEFEYIPLGKNKHKVIKLKDGNREEIGYQYCSTNINDDICIKCGEKYTNGTTDDYIEYGSYHITVSISGAVPDGVTWRIKYCESADEKEELKKKANEYLDSGEFDAIRRGKVEVSDDSFIAYKIELLKEGEKWEPNSNDYVSVYSDVMNLNNGLLINGFSCKIGDVFCAGNLKFKEDAVIEGRCGDSLIWKMQNGVMTVDGEGTMVDAPFMAYHYGIALFRAVKKVVLPEGLVSIPRAGFIGFSSLEEIQIPSTVKSIGDSGIYGTKIKNLILPEGLESIGVCGIAVNSNLESIYVPDSVNYIGEEAFIDCKNLKEISIPCKVTYEISEYDPSNPEIIKRHIGKSSEMVRNEEEHYYLCSCGEEIDKEEHDYSEWITTIEATHSSAGSHYRTCNTCQYVDTQTIPVIEHTFSTVWSSDGASHWRECSCGVKTDIAPHAFSESWNYNADQHWHICSCGATDSLGDHEFAEEWTVEKPATYAADGKESNKCNSCGYTVYRNIPKKDNVLVDKVPSAGGPDSEITYVSNAVKQNVYNQLTAEEKAAVDSGENIKIYTKVNSATFSVTQSQKDKTESAAGEATVAVYLDISMYAKVGSNGEKEVEPNAPVSVTIDIPNEFRNTDSSKKRIYKIIHLLSNGDVETLYAYHNSASNTLTFTTTSFSYFALAYEDVNVPVSALPAGNSSTSSNASTVSSAATEARTIAVSSVLPYGTLTGLATGNKGDMAMDIKLLNTSKRDVTNQAIFANYYATKLGLKSTVVDTKDIYAPFNASSEWKTSPRMMTWQNPGVKPTDTVYVVWYCQEAHDMRFIPAVVSARGTVYFAVPRVGNVSTVSIVKVAK